MDNDLIQDTNLDLLQVNAVEVEYSGIAPINVDNQEHTISLDPSALSSKLDTSAFDEWTATHSAGEEYSAGEGIDITDHVISYTGDPGDATPWISGNKIITSADTMQPGEFIQVLSSFDLSGNKNHFITVKGQGYYFPTNQQLKERVGVEDYLPLSSFSGYTASIASNLENNWNYTNSAYSQSLNNYYNKLDISAFSSWSSEHSGDYLTKESADTLYQPIGDYLTTADSGNFYPMEGNPSGFLTGVDLSNYYEKNETSSKEEIENAITSVENIINNLSGEYYPLTSNPSGYLTAHQSLDDYQKTADMTAYQEAGDYYSASNPSGFITGVDLSDYYKKNETSSKEEISDALTSKLDETAFTSYTSNADTTEYTAGDNIDITDHVISGKDWTSAIASATSGVLTANIPSAFHFSANGEYSDDFVNINVPGGYKPLISASGHAGGPEIISIAASGFDTSSYHGEVHVNENGLLCKQGNTTVQYNTSGAINSKFIADYGGGFSAIPTPVDYYTTAIPLTQINFTGLTAKSSPGDNSSKAIVNLADITYERAGSAWSLTSSIQKREIEGDSATSAITAIAGSAIGGDYYKKNETSSKEEISAAFEALSGIDDPYELSAGDGISIVNDNTAKKTIINSTGISSKLDTTAFTAYTATAIQGFEYTGIAPIDVNNTTHQISADVWTLSGTNGINILEDAQNKITTITYTAAPDMSNYQLTANMTAYYKKNETSSKQEISAALTGKQDTLTIAGSNSIISSINGSALSAGGTYNFDRNVFVDDGSVYVRNYDDSNFVMTSDLDNTYYNASLHNANITSSSRIKIILNEPVDRLVFRPCNASYAPTNYGVQPYYTAFGTAHGNDGMLLTSDVPKTEWYIDIDRINQNTGFYYMQIFPDYNPWEGDYNVSAYLANTGWIDETLATQPWVLSQLTGQGGETIDLSAGEGISIVETANKVLISNNISAGSNMSFVYDSETNKIRIDANDAFPITATDGNTTWSADCKASAFTMARNTSRTDIGAFGFEYRQAPSVNVSGSWYDLGLLMEKFKYAIPVEAVANSGMATGQNILYVVTGN